jgi:DNA-binding response OmpR family regulator
MASPTAAHLLIADGDADVRALYQELFREEGYHVSLCERLPDAADIQRLAPDLVILDFFDSGASALELMRAIRADTTTAGLPLVVCSAALPQVRHTEPELAALDVAIVLKPFDLDELLAVVRQRLRPA